MRPMLFTVWYLLFAVAACSCVGSDDDDDDDTTDDCVPVRSRYIEANVLRARLAAAHQPTESADLLLAEYINRHWECFE